MARRDAHRTPEEVQEFAQVLGRAAAGYGGELPFTAVTKVKAEFMHRAPRWRHVSASHFRACLVDAGLREADAEELAGYLRAIQAGRRLIPNGPYDDFRFYSTADRSRGGVDR